MKDAIIAFSDDAEARLKEKYEYCLVQAKNHALDYVLKGEEESKGRCLEQHIRAVTYEDAIAILRSARQFMRTKI